MEPEHRKRINDFFVVLIIGSILAVMVLGNDGVSKWLQDWSTLIAGLLALAAALITIKQMQRTDKVQDARFQLAESQQQKRHEELIDLNLRAERLRVLRAAIPHGDELIAWGATMKKLVERFDADLGGGGHAPTRELLEELGNKMFHCGYILDDQNVSSAQDLFSPSLTQKFKEAAAYTRRLVEQRDRVQIALFGMAGQEFNFDYNRALDLLRAALMAVRPLIPVAQIIGGSLNRLALEYKGLSPLD